MSIFESLADHAQTSRDTDVLDGICKAESEACNFEQIFPVERNDQCHYARSESGTGDHVFGQADRAGCISDFDDPEKTKAIMDSVRTETEKLESLGKNPIIITSPIVRMYFKKLTEDYFKDLIVVSYNEVESDVELQSVGMVTA